MDVSAPNQNRNVGSRRLRRPPAWRRRQPSTWPPDGSLALHPRPADVFLVTKAILWERGRSHNTKHVSPTHPPSLCPRFLSHMKAHRGGLAAPPCCLAPTSRPDPPPPGLGCGTTLSRRPPTLEGHFDAAQNRTRNDEQKRKLEDEIQSSPVASPHRPPENQPGPEPPVPGQNKLFQASPSDSLPSDVMRRDREKTNLNAPVEPSDDPDWRLETSLDEAEGSGSPTSSVGRPSFSDFSRPTSSLFSRSTSLASGEGSSTSDAKSEDVHPSSPQYHQETRRTSSGPGCSSTPEHRRFNTPVQLPPISSKSILGGTGCGSTEPSVEWPLDAAPPAVPSATWSSRPSPQFSAHRSGSRGGGEATPPAGGPKTRQWAVLPPISPVKGTSEVLSVEREGSWLKYEESRCSSTASRFSELSCSESHVFDELDAIAPPSTSCLSQDEPCDSSDESSAHIELSPGLAALTVGCDSGNLGSLSRVQLLLLNRADPGTLPSPPGFDEDFLREQADEDLELTSAGDLRPDSSCSVARSWSSASKVQRHKSDESDGGSCSSLVVDLSPLSRPSTCRSNFDSSDDDDDEEANENEVSPEEGKFRNRSIGIDDGGGSEEERKMDFRKTKVLNMLSRLQGGNTRRLGSNNGCSNFEDFDFLAKYCIFSPEKLDEYKRAFEREDNDADGYISCFQVLLALKNIIPAELLSDEEEIYVYRILEMVDFKVTDGLVDLRLFAVIASLAQKIATMDDFMRSLINDMDFRSLEVRLFKAKQLFLFLLEEQQEDPQQGFISSEQLLLELKAGGIHLEQEAAVRLQLQNVPPLDLLGFLAYLPLFMIIHNSVIANPLDDSRPLQVERL